MTKVAANVRGKKFSCRAIVPESNVVGEYNVLVEMTVRKGKEKATFLSDPARAAAK